MVTATQLSSYLYCPRKLFLNSVLLIKEPEKQELVKGKIWHETHELLNNASKSIACSIKDSDYQAILDIYRKEYSKFLRNAIIKYKSELAKFNLSMLDIFKEYWPDIEEEAKDQALNLSGFISKNNVFGEELWEKLTPKVLSEQYFKSERLNLSGIVDLIEIYNINGTLSYVPVELKTGKYPKEGMWDGHKVQLGAYILILEDLGKSVNEAVIRYKGEKRLLHMNPFLKDEILDLTNKTSLLLKSNAIPDYVDNKNKCKTCALKDVCYDEYKVKELLQQLKRS